MNQDMWIGRIVDQYRLEANLGQGSLGTTYRAYDIRLERPVALKIVHSNLVLQPRFRQRLLPALRVAAQLDHPAIVRVYDVVVRSDMTYMVMELINGGNLGSYIQQVRKSDRAIDLRDTLAILAHVTDGLTYTHAQGLLHLHLSPANILLKPLALPENPGESPLRAIITDFGLAGWPSDSARTPYMAPEQTQGLEPEARSDIYSLGVILYELTTGRLPSDTQYAGGSQLPPTAAPLPPRALRPGIPTAIEQLVLKALAKSPSQRFASAEMLAQALRETSLQLAPLQVTTFALPQTTANLAVLFEELTAPPQSGATSRREPQKSYPQLVVTRAEEPPQAFALNKAALMIGRSPDNDISLTGVSVSRQHVLLERAEGGWRVTDLNSTNGTFLGDNRLRPNIPVAWAANQPLRIGDFVLQWQPPSLPDSAETPDPARPDTQSAESLPAVPDHLAPHVTLALSPTTLELIPGRRAQAGLEITNQGAAEETFTIAIEGLPPDWVTLPQPTLRLPPGGRQTVPVTLHLPPNSGAAASSRPYRLNVTTQTRPGQRVGVVGQVAIRGLEAFDLAAIPPSVPNRSVVRMEIANRGNLRSTYTITGSNPHESVHFEGLGQQITLEPGQLGAVEVELEAIRRPFFGRKFTLPFDLTVFTAAGVSRQQTSELEVKPFIPTWLIILLLVLLLIGAALWVYFRFGPDLFHPLASAARRSLCLAGLGIAGQS